MTDGLKLTGLDDTLFHQTSDLMAYTPISDHRFFDRSVYGINAPDHSIHLVTSIGLYKNMNVLDGFAMAQVDRHKQYNQRYSRRLSSDFGRCGLGQLQFDVLEPMQRHRVRLAPSSNPISFDLEWKAVLPAHLEDRHEVRNQGRLVRNYSRFDQFGRASGWISIGDRRFEVSEWFSWRDHSWGVRPGVGGYEPFTGGAETEDGYLAVYFWFLTEDAGGFLQLQENGRGEVKYLNGVIQSRNGEPDRSVTAIEHDIVFEPGTRIFSKLEVRFTTEDGKVWHGSATPLGRGWVYKGSGYDNGYNDERGLGFFRGEHAEEADIYDIQHTEDVILPSGETVRPLHREQFSKVIVDGKLGQAHTVVQSTGEHLRYGLGGGAEALPV